MDSLRGSGGEEPKKLVAAAAERNCPHIVDAILPILRERLADGQQRTDLLEVASGTGQHAYAIAKALSGCPEVVVVHPSDLQSDDGFASISAYAADFARQCEPDTVRMETPIHLDCSSETFARDFRQQAGVEQVDVILCVNMTHIAPIEATHGLIASSGELLKEGGALVIYGPFKDEQGNFTTDSNAAFDQSLRARNPQWGYRSVAVLDQLAKDHGLHLDRRIDMPANNFLMVYRRT